MIWRRLDCPGHEWARLFPKRSGSILRGTAIFIEDRIPARLDYRILCNPKWETLTARVLGWKGDEKVDLRIEKGADGSWRINGRLAPQVKGCPDIDLSFSPSTNLLPLKRLAPRIGDEIEVRAAWLRFPELDLQPLVHRFRRLDESHYGYASATGFSTELEVDADGFVVSYPPLWRKEPDA